MKKIRVAQIGIGHNHASEIMSAARRLSDDFEVVAVAEDDVFWRKEREGMAEYSGIRWMSESEIFEIPGLDAVLVEKNDPGLVPAAMKCLERRFSIHMDKPGGQELEAFYRLCRGYESAKLCFQVGYMYRYNPAIRYCLECLRKGWLGDIFGIDAVMGRYDGKNDFYRSWLAGFKGGAMYIFAGHLIDIVIMFMGRPDNVESFLKKTRNDELFDSGLAVMEYPGCTATVRVSVAEVDGMKHRRLLVCGTKGTFEICPLEPPASEYRTKPLHVRLTLLEDNAEYKAGTHDIAMPLMNGRYDSQMQEFAGIVRGKIINPYLPEHEFMVQESLLAGADYISFPQKSMWERKEY